MGWVRRPRSANTRRGRLNNNGTGIAARGTSPTRFEICAIQERVISSFRYDNTHRSIHRAISSKQLEHKVWRVPCNHTSSSRLFGPSKRPGCVCLRPPRMKLAGRGRATASFFQSYHPATDRRSFIEDSPCFMFDLLSSGQFSGFA
jgi:hypothetical protein